jgi:hypothetical protein
MSTSLVVYEYKFPVRRRHWPMEASAFSGPPEMLREPLPAVRPETDRHRWAVNERPAGIYGPDARIISMVSPGLIVDIHV